MNNNQKEKKMYTKGGYIGFINYIQQEEVIVQSINGCLVRCKNKNLTKNNYEGKEEVAFDYFIKNGNIVAIAFPIYRAGNPIESSLKITKDDRANAQNHPQFRGTLSELRELVAAEEKAKADAEAKVAAAKAEVQPAIKEEKREGVKIPSRSYFSELCEWLKGDPVEMIQFIWRIRDNELTPGDNLIIHNLSLENHSEEELSPILDNLEKEVESYVYDSGDFTKEEIAEIERKLDSDSSEVEETLPEEEVPEEAYEYDEDEAEEYENDSSEYEKYDDDSYYEFDDKPSSKREWR